MISRARGNPDDLTCLGKTSWHHLGIAQLFWHATKTQGLITLSSYSDLSAVFT